MADNVASPFAGLEGLLTPLLGSKTVGTDAQTLTTQQQLQQLINSLTTQQQQQTATGATTNVQQTNANIADLQRVFQQQQGGITPDMLKAIFTEGSKAVPGLVATTANAIGARPGGNSPLAATLADLNTNLTSQAATMNQKMLADSATTAAQIAALTKSVTDTGTTGTTQNLTGTTGVQSTQNQTGTTQQTKRDDSTSTTGINTKQVGVAAGLAGLVSLLGNSGVSGDIINQVKGLFGGGTGGGDTGLGLTNPYDTGGVGTIDNPGGGYTGPPGLGGYGTNPYTTPDAGNVGIPETGDVTDWSSTFGFADGGQVPTPSLLKITDSPRMRPPSVTDLLALGGGTGGLASLLGGGSGNAANPIPLTSLIPHPSQVIDAGGNAGPGGTGSNAPSGPGIGGLSMSTPSIGQVANVGLAALSANVPGMIAALANIAINNISMSQATPETPESTVSEAAVADNATEGTADQGTDSDSDSGVGGGSGADAGGTGAAGSGSGSGSGAGTGGGSGADAGGTGAAGSGSGSGDSGGDGGGWADGGHIPNRTNDPRGVMDPLQIPVSGGEFIIPKDVVDTVGPHVFDSLIAMFHTPAIIQRNQSMNRVSESESTERYP